MMGRQRCSGSEFSVRRVSRRRRCCGRHGGGTTSSSPPSPPVDPAAAAAYAKEHGIDKWYDSYEQLLRDSDIDVVYNALPPSEHAAWSIAALEAGKHVLCEKPAGMNAAQAGDMVAAAERAGRRLIEAFHDRHHPLFAHLLDVRDSGDLGRIERVEGNFHAPIRFNPASIRHDPKAGGGALMDLGCYPIHWLRTFVGEEPTVVSASATPNPLGADQTIEAELRFPSGVQGRVQASMNDDVPFGALLTVTGSEGTVEVDNPVLPHRGHSVRMTIKGVSYTHTIGGGETYDYQLDDLVRAIAGAPSTTEGMDIVANMVVIDAIYDAASWRQPRVESHS